MKRSCSVGNVIQVWVTITHFTKECRSELFKISTRHKDCKRAVLEYCQKEMPSFSIKEIIFSSNWRLNIERKYFTDKKEANDGVKEDEIEERGRIVKGYCAAGYYKFSSDHYWTLQTSVPIKSCNRMNIKCKQNIFKFSLDEQTQQTLQTRTGRTKEKAISWTDIWKTKKSWGVCCFWECHGSALFAKRSITCSPWEPGQIRSSSRGFSALFLQATLLLCICHRFALSEDKILTGGAIGF